MIEKASVLIVEDEMILGMDLKSHLNKMGYTTLPLAKTPDKALEILSTSQPDILILDIHLGKQQMDGIALASDLKKRYDLPFIFVTSHAEDHYIERAKAVEPNAYILKPFNYKEIEIAIELALANFSGGKTSNVVTINDSLFLKKNHHFERVRFEQILWLKADGNYTEIKTTTETFIYSMILKKVEMAVPKDQFYRVHRSYIVNKERIAGFSGNTLIIEKMKIPVSHQYRSMVFSWFNTL